jgi:endonuclease G
MSQAHNLEQDEFVFGAFTSPQLNITTQVPIRSIELRSGIDFGGLVAVDPLSSEEAPDDGQGARLERFEQIRFV